MASVQSIIIRPEKRGPVHHIDAVQIRHGGIEGDHYAKPDGHRHITLIAADALSTVAATIGFQGDAHTACRRNICVDTLPAGNLTGHKIQFGEQAIIEITGYCTPCQRMNENFGDGAVQAFGSLHAGWTARVIREGFIRKGDQVHFT